MNNRIKDLGLKAEESAQLMQKAISEAELPTISPFENPDYLIQVTLIVNFEPVVGSATTEINQGVTKDQLKTLLNTLGYIYNDEEQKK